MKKLLTFILPLALLGCTMSGASPAPRNIRVVTGETPKPSGKKHTYTESPSTPLNLLYSPEQAKKVVDNFKIAYAKMGQPRIDIRVNLPYGTVPASPLPVPGVQFSPTIDPNTGLPRTQLLAGAAPIPANPAPAGAPVPTQIFDASALTERQTQREVETLFGRPLRRAGAQLHQHVPRFFLGGARRVLRSPANERRPAPSAAEE